MAQVECDLMEKMDVDPVGVADWGSDGSLLCPMAQWLDPSLAQWLHPTLPQPQDPSSASPTPLEPWHHLAAKWDSQARPGPSTEAHIGIPRRASSPESVSKPCPGKWSLPLL
jgi:hypothetical protein